MATGIEQEIEVDVPQSFAPYVEAAVLRLSFLHKGIAFSEVDKKISVRWVGNPTHDELRQAVSHALYREKIYHETLPERLLLIRALTNK